MGSNLNPLSSTNKGSRIVAGVPDERIPARASVTPRHYMSAPLAVNSGECHIHLAISQKDLTESGFRRSGLDNLSLWTRLDNALRTSHRRVGLELHALGTCLRQGSMSLTRESTAPGGSLSQSDTVQVLSLSHHAVSLHHTDRFSTGFRSQVGNDRKSDLTGRGFRLDKPNPTTPVGVVGFGYWSGPRQSAGFTLTTAIGIYICICLSVFMPTGTMSLSSIRMNPSVLISISYILPASVISQVINIIIQLVTIIMTYLHSGGFGADKGQSHKDMNRFRITLAILIRSDNRHTLTIWRGFQNDSIIVSAPALR